MLPFLLIQTRPADDVVAEEYRTTAELGGFREEDLAQFRLDQVVQEQSAAEPEPVQAPSSVDAAGADAGFPAAEDAVDATDPDADAGTLGGGPEVPTAVDWDALLAAHSGIILCGSPFNSSDPDEAKSELQHRVETELRRMLDLVVARDYPFLGACYGVGTLGLHQGGVVDHTYGETPAAIDVTLTEEGRKDPLLAGIPDRFEAFVGHKEAVHELPPQAVLLASGENCPVQMFRIGQNMYATQFHPELDTDAFLYRLEVYRDHGYYGPDEAEAVFAQVRASHVVDAQKVLGNFRERYGRDA